MFASISGGSMFERLGVVMVTMVVLALNAAASSARMPDSATGASPIDPGPWFQFQPAAAGDPDGQVLVTWTDFRDGVAHIRYAAMPPGEPWQASERLDPAGTGAQQDSHLAMDGRGNLYAVWYDERGDVPQIYFSHQPAGGEWQASTPVSPTLASQISPNIDVNTRGEAIVTWVQGKRPDAIVMAALRSPDGVWSAPQQVAPPGQVYNTSAAIDDWGRAYAAWEDWASSQAYFSERPPGGPWGLLEIMRDDPTDVVWAPRIAVDGAGNVHAVWEDERTGTPGVFAAYRPAGGRWSANVQVADLGWMPGVGLDRAGNAIVAWQTPNGDLYRAIRYLGGGWSQAELLYETPPEIGDKDAPRRAGGSAAAFAPGSPQAITSDSPSTVVLDGGTTTIFSIDLPGGNGNINAIDSPGPCNSMLTAAAQAPAGRPTQFGGGNACRNGPQDPANEGDPGFIGPLGPPEGTQIGGWHIQTQVVDGQTVYIVDTPGSDGVFTSFSDANDFASNYQYTPPGSYNFDDFNLNDFPFDFGNQGNDPGGDPDPQPTVTPQATVTPEATQEPVDNGPPGAWASNYARAMNTLQGLQDGESISRDDFAQLVQYLSQYGSTASPGALINLFRRMENLPPGWRTPNVTWLATMTPEGFARLQRDVAAMEARIRAESQPTQSNTASNRPGQSGNQGNQNASPISAIVNHQDAIRAELGSLANWRGPGNGNALEQIRNFREDEVGRLRYMDNPGNGRPLSVYTNGGRTNDPVLLHSGEFIYSLTPLRLPGRGFNYEFTLTYRSQMIYEGPVGWGWRHNYDQRLVETGAGSFARQESSGRMDEFTWDGVRFTAAAGLFETVLVDTGGITIHKRNGVVETYLPFDDAAAPGALQSISDRNSNSMTFAYDAQGRLHTVTDTLGHEITYAYDAQGFLTTITDHSGRQVKIMYDAHGDLASITTPEVTGTPHGNDFPVGKTTRFQYTSGLADDRLNHNLTTIISPNEVADGSLTPRTINTYGTEGLAFDRIIAQSWGGGRMNASGVPAGGDLSIAYSTVIEGEDPTGAASKTTLTDRGGHMLELWHDGAGHRLRERQVASGETIVTDKTYNLDGKITSITFAMGNRVEYEYDEGIDDPQARGNLLAVRHVADATRGCDGLGAAPCPDLVTTMTYEPDFQFVKTISDAAGNTLTNTYDARGNRTGVDYPDVTAGPAAPQTASARWTYNVHGQPLTFTDPEGNVSRYEYYDSGPATGYRQRTIAADGDLDLVTTYEYDDAGNLTATIDPLGVRREYAFNALNQMVALRKDAGGLDYEIRYWYDANDNLVRSDVENVLPALDADFRPSGHAIQDAANPWLTTRYVFDLLDNPVQRREEIGDDAQAVTEYRYDALENPVSITSPDGNRQEYVYDERGLVMAITEGAGTEDASTITFAYDANGKTVRVTDGEGNHSDFFYDGFDRQVGIVDALGNIRHWELDANGNTASLRQFDGQEGRNPARLLDAPDAVLLSHVQNSYDERNRRYLVRRRYFSADLAEGALTPINGDGDGDGWVETTTGYDRNGKVLQHVDDNGNVRDYSYDGLSRLLSETDPLGNGLAYAYDGNGNLVTIKASEHQPEDLVSGETYTTTYEYDALNRMIGQSDAAGHIERYRQDSRNNLVWQADANGNTMLYSYDGLNRLLSSTSHLRAGGLGSGAVLDEVTTHNEYDAGGNRTRTLDANGNATAFTYDALGRQISAIFADGSSASYIYDHNSNLVGKIDANGSVFTYSYDGLNRLVQTAIDRAEGVAGTTVQTFSYDGLSRPTRSTDNNEPADPGDDSILATTYDSLSHTRSESQNGETVISTYDGIGNRLTLAYPGGATLTFTYDALDRLRTLVAGGDTLATYDYIGPRRMLRRSDGNGTYVAYGYDDARRLNEISYRKQSGDVPINGFSYTLDAAGKILNETAQPGGVSTTYAYDSLNRLVAFQRPGLSQTFAYDPAGNRTRETRNGRMIEYAVDAMNRYSSIAGVAQTHDSNGNLLDDGSSRYEYDALNRLIRSESIRNPLFLPWVAASGNEFDQSDAMQPAQLPMTLRLHSYDALNRRIRLNDGGDVARFLYDNDKVIEERDGEDVQIASIVGDLLTERAGQRSFYQVDALGSVRSLADAGGEVVERLDYEAFGKPLFGGGGPWLWRWWRFDAGDGLYVLDGRRYDPVQGRNLQMK